MTDKDKAYPLPIVTPRLVLRPATLADAEEITHAKKGVWDQLQLWMSWAYDGEETHEATLKRFSDPDRKKLDVLLGRCRDTGKIVLFTGLAEDPEEGLDVYHTGYWVTKDFLGKGYATEGTNAAIRYAFNVLGAKKITIAYYEGNDKSRRIIDKLGFQYARTDEKSKDRCSDGELVDVHLYSMTDETVLPPLDVNWGTEP